MKQKTRRRRASQRAKVRTPRRVTAGRKAAWLSESPWRVLLLCLGLAAITWIVFGRTIGFGFVNYDDSYYVYQNPSISEGFTTAGLVKAFTQPLVGNWHPLTSISLMLDAQWSHLYAGGYHFTNVLLHSIAVLLLFLALRQLTGAVWRSAFVAALFAIHPLRAESVVWISERKDVLSGVFFMLGLLTYYRYARRPQLTSYLLLTLVVTLGLLSKAMLVTVPFLLLLLDYWPLRRLDWQSARRLVLEKVPLLFLSAATCAATILSQERALAAGRSWSLLERIENALVTIWIYVRQMFWPADLAVFYPHPKEGWPVWLVTISALLLVLVSAAAVIWRKRVPYLFTGWFWYLGMLVPVIGIIQVGWQAHADRYTYLPQIGLYLVMSWGLNELSASWPRRNWILGSAATVVILVLMFLASRQVGYWSSPVALWRQTLAVTIDNDVAERGLGTALIQIGEVDEAIAHDCAALRIRPHDINGLTNLANALLQKGELPEAIANYREVVRLRPNDNDSHRNLGKALLKNGESEAAIAEFRAALRVRSTDSDAAYSLGNALLAKGDIGGAIESFQKAIAADPKNVAAHYNLGIALQRAGEPDAGVAQFRETLRLDPKHVEAHNNLAIALLKKGLTDEAIAEWQKALELQPANAEIDNNLGVALLNEGRIAEAVAKFRETLRLQPNKVPTALTLAWILSTAPEEQIRDGAGALEYAKQAYRLAGDRNVMAYRVLAAALAENGKYDDAINLLREAIARAQSADQAGIAELLQNDLALYEGGVPLRDSTHGRGAGAR